jgi:hypothetical protein
MCVKVFGVAPKKGATGFEMKNTPTIDGNSRQRTARKRMNPLREMED